MTSTICYLRRLAQEDRHEASHGEDKIRAAIDGAIDFVDVQSAAPIDLKDAGLTQREALLQICDAVDVWRSPCGDVFVSCPLGQHIEHYPIESRSFRQWMLHELARRYSDKGRPASAGENALRDARAAVEARALLHPKTHETFQRVAEHKGEIFLDLGDRDWSAMQVTKSGWSHANAAPVPILRSKRTAPFALPNANGDFVPLRRLLSHLDHDTFVLFVAWCLGALLPRGPYSVLVLGGEQGSGKSTLARLAQRLTDPVNGDLLQPPRTDRDLVAAAKANRVLTYDNVSSLSAELADSFCRLSTGSEIGGRALFSDHDTASFSASRPIIINGIPDLAARCDLADRAVVLRLPKMSRCMTEKDWRSQVEAILPATLVGMLDALSYGLKMLDATPTPNLRMADFARFVLAAEPKLPWEAGNFIAAYQRNRLEAVRVLADGDVVVRAIDTFLGPDPWTGFMAELYDRLSQRHVLRPADWPGNPRWFGDRLRRAAPTLRAIGIDSQERRESGGTCVTLRRIAPLDTLEPPTVYPGRGAGGANGASAPISF